MSADNGIYVLETNAVPVFDGKATYTNRHGVKEYRVAICQAIENIEYSDLYLPLLFGHSKVFENKTEAMQQAKELYDLVMQNFGICEYGIQQINLNKQFPNMTAAAAAKALNCYVGAKPLDYDPLEEVENWDENG